MGDEFDENVDTSSDFSETSDSNAFDDGASETADELDEDVSEDEIDSDDIVNDVDENEFEEDNSEDENLSEAMDDNDGQDDIQEDIDVEETDELIEEDNNEISEDVDSDTNNQVESSEYEDSDYGKPIVEDTDDGINSNDTVSETDDSIIEDVEADDTSTDDANVETDATTADEVNDEVEDTAAADDVNAETEDTTADEANVETDETVAKVAGVDTSSEINSLSDYMNAHNYGLDDFSTYSQDPQWRQLIRQEHPDYELPEMSQESANAQLSQYMNDHNYGIDDYAEYSQDPTWIELHTVAFPNDELLPLNSGNESNKDGIISSIFGNRETEDVSGVELINQIVQTETRSTNINDLNQEYDHSFEAQELRDMGIKNVDLRDCSPEYRGDIVDAVKDMFREYLELKDQLSDVRCYSMKDGTYSSYGPTGQGMPFGGKLNLNSKYFSSGTLRANLAEEGRKGWSVPNVSPRSIVSHELGHGVHLGLCAKACGITPGTIPDTGKYRDAVRQYIDDAHADTIIETACNDLGVEFDSWNFANELTRYGASNYGEAIAEAVAEVRNNVHPRPMASAIYSRLMQYKNNMNGGKFV